MKNHFKSGEWNLICDSCAKKIKSSIAKQRWDGFIVCPDCYEQRHPQDFVKAKIDKIIVPYIRPPNDIFITVAYRIYVDDGYVLNGYIDNGNL